MPAKQLKQHYDAVVRSPARGWAAKKTRSLKDSWQSFALDCEETFGAVMVPFIDIVP